MSDYSELKPCPFCGGSDQRQYSFRAALDVHYAVQCYCGARSEGQIEREAVEAWNERKPYDALIAENEALLEAITKIMRVTKIGDEAFDIACLVVGELCADAAMSKNQSNG